MIAYNKNWLYSLFVQNEAHIALEEGLVSEEEKNNIDNAYTSAFYTPNVFIRIGLFILTNIISSFSFGFFSLLCMGFIEKALSFLLVSFAAIAAAALEFMIKRKRHYHSGVDDSLMLTAAALFFSGLSYALSPGSLGNCLLLFTICLAFTVRYAARFMAVVCFLSLLGFFFFTCTSLGITGKQLVPVVIMLFSLGSYIYSKKMLNAPGFNVYKGCFQIVGISSLITLPAAGNYWVVRELSNSLFNLQLRHDDTIPYGWLFWLLTIIIPFIYLLSGIKQKDSIRIRISLLAAAALVFTVRYYHAVLPAEVAMVIGGAAMIVAAYILSRYLHIPKYGFSSLPSRSGENIGTRQLESLVIAETFSRQTPMQDDTQFGGGSFGGGGASSNF